MLIFPSFFNAGAPTYEIEQSLRFDGTSGKLTRTNPASSGITNAYKWSYSFWLKHSDVSSSGTIEQPLLSGGNTPGAGRTYCGWGYSSAGRFWIGGYNGSAYIPDIRPTDRVWRDPGAWEHFMLVYDTSESVNTDRIKIYSNGVRWEPTGGVGGTIGSTQLFYAVNYESRASNIGFDNILTKYFDGYMAEVHFVDGQALDQYDFGEFDNNGVWRPIAYTGTYGLNGHYLKFDPTATNGIGHDHSGNGNHWTATGFSTSGTGTDVMSDTPTTNWCTLNPLEKPGGTAPVYENGNLTLRNSTNYFFSHGVGTFGLNSGKWYFETSGDGSIYTQIGFVDSSQIASMTGGGGISVVSRGWSYQSNGIIRGVSNTYQDTGLTAASTAGDIMGLAIDFDAGEASWYVNGTQVGSTVDFSSYLAAGRIWYPVVAVTNEGTDITNVNFGQRDFAYTPPTGFKALNTSNLPAPTVKDGSEYFNTVLYSGSTNNTQNITGVGFQSDLTWIKSRNSADSHTLSDAVRGAGIALRTNSTAAEADNSSSFTSFDTDGFTVAGGSGDTNQTGNNYVAWNWKKGATPGFDIVTYTGNGYPTTNSQSIAHNLGVKPAFIAIKNRDRSSQWLHYVGPLGATKGMEGWHDANTAFTNANYFNNTEPTSTHFTVGYDSGGNWQGDDFIAYLWAEVDGFFKVGTYERNGSTDGPYIHLGFAPALVIIKEYAAGTEGWSMIDSKRPGYNPNDNPVLTNSTNTENYMVSTYVNDVDLLSNGFKIRNSDSRYNSTLSSYRYLYFAWAENPFGGDGVSPATAR